MILLDTCALIFDALTPERLTQRAKKSMNEAEQQSMLFCSDISLWEIAMYVKKKRLEISTDTNNFLRIILNARRIQVLPINIDIATLSCDSDLFLHGDPADRLIAATAIHHHAKLITSDSKLQGITSLEVIW